MKFTTITQKVAGTYTRDGKTIPVTRNQEIRTPVLPRDWQTIALRAAITITGVLTLLAVIWSTWSIGSLLGGGVGFTVAVIFDIGWAVALLLEYLARYDEAKRTFPERLGWVLLAVTMGAIAWHGVTLDNYGMAVVGAFVSFFAKVLWIAVMQHVNANLSDDDKQWLAAEISDAQTKAAIATMRRQTARTEQRAALELLAMERERVQVSEAFGLPTADVPRSTADVPAPEIEAPTLGDLGKADAVRFVLRQLGEASPEDVHDVLTEARDDIDLKYVRTVISRLEPEAEADVIELRK